MPEMLESRERQHQMQSVNRDWIDVSKPYKGYLAPHIDIILESYRAGTPINKIADGLLFYYPDLGRSSPYYGRPRGQIRASIRNLLKRLGALKSQGPVPPWNGVYGVARQEHAFLLRCEGLKLKEIGDRLGVSSSRVRELHFKFIHLINHKSKTRRTRWRLVESDSQRESNRV